MLSKTHSFTGLFNASSQAIPINQQNQQLHIVSSYHGSNQPDENDDNSTLEKYFSDEKLRKKIYKIGPRRYKFDVENSTETVVIPFFGCQGVAQAKNVKEIGSNQRNVAILLDKSIAEFKAAYLFVPFCGCTGDIIYPSGISSPRDRAIQNSFELNFKDKNLPYLYETPIVATPGNHDAGRDKPNMLLLKGHNTKFSYVLNTTTYTAKPIVGDEACINLHAYSLVSSQEEGITPEKAIEIYSQSQLNSRNTTHFISTYFFNAYDVGKMRFIYIDSNTILHDYIDYVDNNMGTASNKTNYNPKKFNQINFIFEQYASAKQYGMKICFVQHHTFQTSGKRAKPEGYDTGHYFVLELQPYLGKVQKYLETDSYSYNELIFTMFRKLGLLPDILFAAHDHYNEARIIPVTTINEKEKTILQITAGGGGGPLQELQTCQNDDNILVQANEFGAFFLKFNPFNPEKIEIELRTTNGLKVCFVNNQLIQKDSTDNEAKELRLTLLEICSAYMQQLHAAEIAEDKKSEKTSSTDNSHYFFAKPVKFAVNFCTNATQKISEMFWTSDAIKELNAIHQLRAYLNQYELPHYQQIQFYVDQLKIPAAKENNLRAKLNDIFTPQQNMSFHI